MQPQTVVITVPWGARAGGAEQLLWTILNHIDRQAVRPVVVFLEPGPFVEEVEQLGIRTYVVPAGRLRQLRRAAETTRALARVLRSEEPELLVDWTPKTHLYGALGARLAGIGSQTVWWQHGIPKRNWFDLLVTALPARCVICSSAAAASAQSRLWPRRRTVVSLPGIDVKRTDPRELDAIRDGIGIPRERFVLAVVGRLQPGKRQDAFIDVVLALRQRGHPVHGLIVGGTAFGLSPEYEPYLRSKVELLGLTDCVTFTEQVEDAAAYIQFADVLVSTSESESFGISVVEALALETPVVAFDSDGPGEIIEHDVSGLLAKHLLVEDLADAVERVIVEPDLGGRLSRVGVARYHELFTGERAAQRFAHVLSGVIRAA